MGTLELVIDKVSEHVATVVATGIGAYAGNILRLIHKNKRDLDAVFPKVRTMQDELTKLKEERCACKHLREVGTQVVERGLGGESYRLDAMGNSSEDDIVPA